MPALYEAILAESIATFCRRLAFFRLPDDFDTSAYRATAQDVLAATSYIFSVSVSELRGPSKMRYVAQPRQLACLAMRDLIGLSYPQIARFTGRSDHTGAIHNVRTMRAKCDTDATWAYRHKLLINSIPVATWRRVSAIVAGHISSAIREVPRS